MFVFSSELLGENFVVYIFFNKILIKLFMLIAEFLLGY